MFLHLLQLILPGPAVWPELQPSILTAVDMLPDASPEAAARLQLQL